MADRIRKMAESAEPELIAASLRLPLDIVKGILSGEISDKVLDDYNLEKSLSKYMRLLKHDQSTMRHCQRVTKLSLQIANLLGLQKEQKENLAQAAMLHDIGKIFIPRSILYKEGRLTLEEWEIIKQHPVKGAEIISKKTYPADIIEGILYHHEHYNGSGYPEGLAEKEIPLFSRIIAIADAYDAMTSPRPYRTFTFTSETATREILIHAGAQFDPEICEAFLDIVEKQRLENVT